MTRDKFVDIISNTAYSQKTRDFLEEIFVNGKSRAQVCRDYGISAPHASITIKRFKEVQSKLGL